MKFKTRKDESVPTINKGATEQEVENYNTSMSQVLGKNFRDTRRDLDEMLTYVNTQIGNMIKMSKKNGLVLSNNSSDANNDIDISAGSCPDSTYVVFMSGSAMTKRLDATWAAGTNQGGLFAGLTKANSTWYAVFAIYKDSDKSVDYGFDTSTTATHKPSGYSKYSLIGWIRTNSSGNILQFFQIGNRIYWVTPVLDFDSTIGTTSSTSITLTTPPCDTVAIMNVYLFRSGASPDLYLFNSRNTDSAPSTTASPLATLRSTSTTLAQFGRVEIPTTAGAIRARADAASTTLRLATLGWIDQNI